MQYHKLKLDDNKTEIIWCATEKNSRIFKTSSIKIDEIEIPVANKAKNLGVVLNSVLNILDDMDFHNKI